MAISLPFTLPEIPTTIHSLSNGLTLLIREIPGPPIVSVQFWVKTGSIHEGIYAGAGISHLVEHMVFKGTKNFSGDDLSKLVQGAGGHWNAYTSNSRTVYHIDGPKESFDTFAKVLADLVFFPSFPENEFEKEKEVIRREIAMYADDPASVAWENTLDEVWRINDRKWPIIGLIDRFNNLTRQDVVKYHKERYAPMNVIVSVAGNIPAKDVISQIKTLIGEVNSRHYRCASTEKNEPILLQSRTRRKEYKTSVSRLQLVWRIPRQAEEDFPALKAFAKILNNGNSAWFKEKFHDRLKLAHDISVNFMQEDEQDSLWVIDAEVDPQKRDQLRDAILEEIELLSHAGDFSNAGATLLRFDARLKSLIKCEFADNLRTLTTAYGQAATMARNWIRYGNPSANLDWLASYQKLQASQIATTIQKWLVGKPIIECSLDPISKKAQVDNQLHEMAQIPISEHKLSNGLKVVIKQDKRLPLAYFSLMANAGSIAETAQNAGITSLLADCLPKGTQSRDLNEVSSYLENLGGEFDTVPGADSIEIQASVLSENVSEALEIIADVALNPTLSNEVIDLEREQILALIDEENEDPLNVAIQQCSSGLFGLKSYGLPILGTEESLLNIQHEELENFRKKIFSAQNCVLSVVGDVTEEEILCLAEKWFAQMPEESELELCAISEFHSGEKTISLEKNQAVLTICYPGPTAKEESLIPAKVFIAWCMDMSGPIFTEIREQRGLAYYASAGGFSGAFNGSIIFYLGTDIKQFDEAKSVLKNLIQKMSQEGMTENELERTKTSLLAEIELKKQNPGRIATSLSSAVIKGLDVNYSEEFAARIKSISREEIQNFTKTWLNSSCCNFEISVTP